MQALQIKLVLTIKLKGTGEAVVWAWPNMPSILVVCLGVIGLIALTGLVIGAVTVVRAERRNVLPSRIAQMAGGAGVLSLGATGGIALAIWTLMQGAQAKAVESSSELTTPAYVILFVMLGILVLGLGWCFYRAIKAAPDKAEPKLPEDGEGPP